MYNQFNPYQPQQFMNPMPQRSEIIKVNGENGARTFQLAPNSSALLLDETAPIVWLVQTDGAGYKTVSAYNITPHQAQPQANINDIETRLKKVEEMLNESNSASNERKKKSNE